MSEFPQAERDRQQHVALRIMALPLRWDVKIEIWQEELAQSETTFCLVLKRHGVDVPEYEPADDSFLLGEMPE